MQPPEPPHMVDDLWPAVRRLIDQAPALKDLRAHRVQLLAAELWRADGVPVPAALALEELASIQRAAGAMALLRKMREAYDGRLVILKGATVARAYPTPLSRPSVDLDVLVDDPDRAQAALIAAGLTPVGPYGDDYYAHLHHLRPLILPDVVAPLVELHRRPNWVPWQTAPQLRDLEAHIVDAEVGVDGLETLAAPAHAVALAAHSWGELPLRRLSDFVDIAAILPASARPDAAAIAAHWDLDRLWETTARVVDQLFGEAPPTTPLMTWGRNLRSARDCTVLEEHLRRWVGPFWAMTPGRALGRTAQELMYDGTPTPDEGWTKKLNRVREAALNPGRPRSDHREALGGDARRPRYTRQARRSAPLPAQAERQGRLLLISPVYNEAAHIERVVRAVNAQERPPTRWIVVDDGSTDGTLEILSRLEREVAFMEVLTRAPEATDATSDRLAVALEAKAFNRGLRHAGPLDGFTYVGKLDGDIEPPPEWFQTILGRMDATPELGIAGATLEEPDGDRMRRLIIPEYHVHGAVKVYRRDCFYAIGGIQERLAWDTIDETYARMRGYATRSYRDLVGLHLRPAASADGQLRGRARHGECARILHYPLWWILLRAFKIAGTDPPRGLSGLWFIYGYVRAALQPASAIDDPEFRRFTRRELRARLRGAMAPAA